MNKIFDTRKTVLTAILACMALCIYAIEYLIPFPVPIPGAKIGLANTVTLAAFYIVGKKRAFSVIIVRIILSALLFGNMMSLAYSISGGILCYVVIFMLSFIAGEEHIWALGVFGALAHNLGQVLMAVAVLGDFSIMYYYLYLIVISVFAGSFTGLCAAFTVKAFRKTKLKNYL